MICRVRERTLRFFRLVFNMAAVGIAKNLTKVTIAGGALYVTIQQGVWTTNTDQGSKVLDTLRSTVAPTAMEYISKIPSGREVNNSIVSAWNKGVTTTFSTISQAPEYAKLAMERTKKLFSE